MNTNDKRHLDLKKRGAAATAVNEEIQKKDITLMITLPGRAKGVLSSKLPDKEVIKIWIADTKRLEDMPYWIVEKEFKKLSKRAKQRILQNRPWFFGIDTKTLPKEFVPVPYYHEEQETSNVRQVMNITDEQVSDFISPDIYPPKFTRKKTEWQKMTERQRLTFNFNLIADGNPYRWEYVE